MSGRIEGFDDLAIITVPARTAPGHDINATGTAEVLVSRTSRGGWASIVNEDYFWEADYSFHAADPRPVVLIDPEDAPQVAEFALLYASQDRGDVFPKMQAALREFANPTPPKPAEPTGLGAVVEDSDGALWVRNNPSGSSQWSQADSGALGLALPYRSWKDIDAVRVLTEGVTE